MDAQILNIYPQSHQGDLKVAVVRVIYPQATVVMDMERDQIYYLSVSGTEEVSDWMEGELEKEEPEGDFASVCQALSWSWETSAQKNLGTGTEGAINAAPGCSMRPWRGRLPARYSDRRGMGRGGDVRHGTLAGHGDGALRGTGRFLRSRRRF